MPPAVRARERILNEMKQLPRPLISPRRETVSDTEKFEATNSTLNEGLRVKTHEGESKHFGAPLLQRRGYTLIRTELVQIRRSR